MKEEIKNPFLDIVDRVIKPDFDVLFEGDNSLRMRYGDNEKYNIAKNRFKTYLNEEYDFMFCCVTKLQDYFKTQDKTFILNEEDLRFYLKTTTIIRSLKSILDLKISLIYEYLYNGIFNYYVFTDYYNMIANTIIKSVNNMSFSESDKEFILDFIASSLDMNTKGFNNLSFSDCFEFEKR